MEVSVEVLLKAMEKKDYRVFEHDKKNYNINIIGIRSADTTVNTFNDLICVMWKYQGQWTLKQYKATTDPGLYWLNHPMQPTGTAIVCPGQYLNIYHIGLHRGEYEALTQIAPITFYRDNNLDDYLNMDDKTVESAVCGINIHHAGQNSKIVDKWSAGCQVIASMADWDEFIGICKKSKAEWGNLFSYTLLTENDLS